MLKRLVSFITSIAFVAVNILPAAAQSVVMPAPGTMVGLSAPFQPVIFRGIKLDPKQPFRFDFIVDQGDKPLQGEAFNDETRRLASYFLASLTIPEKDLWVNLSPYENNRIIEENFGRTTMGRDILEVDYLLKQITSSLMHPDSDLGKKFWAEVYRRAYEKFGTTDIPVDTFNKVWIVPQKAVVYEKADQEHAGVSAYIDSARLKVMLDTDYFAAAQNASVVQPAGETPSKDEISPAVIREVILPVLEEEVNNGQNFAQLRQVYYSMLLAVWFKKKLTQGRVGGGHILSDIFIDRQKTAGNESADPKAEIGSIYTNYVEAFKKGAYNLIKEERDLYSDELIPRKYFSGGLELDPTRALDVREGTSGTAAQLTNASQVVIDIRSAVATLRIPLKTVPVSSNWAWMKQWLPAFFAGFLFMVASPLNALAGQPYPSSQQVVAMPDPVVLNSPVTVERSVVSSVLRYKEVQARVFGPVAWKLGVKPETVFSAKYLGMAPADINNILKSIFPQEGDDFTGVTQEALNLRWQYLAEFREIGFDRSDILKLLMAIGGKESGLGESKTQSGGAGSGLLQFDGQDDYFAAYKIAIHRGVDLPNGANMLSFARNNPDVYLKVALVKLSSEVSKAKDMMSRINANPKLQKEVNDWFPGIEETVRTKMLYTFRLYMGWNAGAGYPDRFYLNSFRKVPEAGFDIKKLHEDLGIAKIKWNEERASNKHKILPDRSQEKKLQGVYLQSLRAYNVCHVLMQIDLKYLLEAKIIPEMSGTEMNVPAALPSEVFMAKPAVIIPSAEEMTAKAIAGPAPIAVYLKDKGVAAGTASAPIASAPGRSLTALEISIWNGLLPADKKELGIEKEGTTRTVAVMEFVSQKIPVLKGSSDRGKGIGLLHLGAQALRELKINAQSQSRGNVRDLIVMLKTVDAAEVGGVDLNSAWLNMDVQGQSGAVNYQFTPEQIRTLNADVPGFVPVIVSSAPVSDVGAFLGFK